MDPIAPAEQVDSSFQAVQKPASPKLRQSPLSAERDSWTHDKKRRTTQLKLGDTERGTRKIAILLAQSQIQ